MHLLRSEVVGWLVLIVLSGAHTSLGRALPAPVAQVTDCNATAVMAAVTAGGLVDINCTAPTVLAFATELVVSKPTEIIGHNTVTFDGQNLRRVLRTENNIPLTLRDLTIKNGKTPDQGGGLKIGFWNTLRISNVRFENNQATKDTAPCDGGGAIFIGGGSVATINDSMFINNRANNGGAINSLRTSLTVTNSRFESNVALHTSVINQYGDCGGGGAIYIDGGRMPPDGGPDRLLLRDTSFTANSTNNHGGAVFAGLYTGETLTIDRASFTANSVSTSPSADWSGTGGAIWHGKAAGGVNNERLILTNSTLADNRAIGQGGGLWVSAPTTISNVTFSGNDATDPTTYPPDSEWKKGNGGAVAVANDAPVDINATTFANNHAGFNGGAIAGRTITVRNTLFANNRTDWSIKIMQHCTDALTDGGGNLQYPPKNPNPNYWNETNCTHSIAIADPTLGALADNGGPTRTMALHAGSPAINAGNSASCPGLDQRRYARVGPCDSGAYEFGGMMFVPTHMVYIPAVQR